VTAGWSALLAAAAVWLVLGSGAGRRRLAAVLEQRPPGARPEGGPAAGLRAGPDDRSQGAGPGSPPSSARGIGARRAQLGPGAAATTAGTAVALVVGGWPGLVAGPVAGVAVLRYVSRLEPAAVRRRRLRVAADLPLAVDLLLVCLLAGRPVSAAVGVVGEAVEGPLGHDLLRISARIELGADPLTVWADTGDDAALGPLGRTFVRAIETGAPVAESLGFLATDLRSERRAAADDAARRVAVRSAGPLGLCFLPAFVLVGIVPTIIGSFRTLLG
jgi:Flp pilus assembly protein TadB